MAECEERMGSDKRSDKPRHHGEEQERKSSGEWGGRIKGILFLGWDRNIFKCW